MEIGYSPGERLLPSIIWCSVMYEGIPEDYDPDLWLYGDYYWDLVIDFLNLDIRRIADIDNFLDSKEAEYENVYSAEKRYRCVQREISSIDYIGVKSLVDHVLLDGDFSNITASQKFSAYWYTFDNVYDVISYDSQVSPASGASSNKDYELSRLVKAKGERGFREMCTIYSSSPNTITYSYNILFSSLENAVKYFLHQLIKDDVCVKVCPNCGRYFVPVNRSDTKYCSNEAPQDSTRTCQSYMKYSNFLNKSRNDEATRLYKQIYNAKKNKVRRCNGENKHINNDLERFIESAKQWKADVKAGTKSEAEYIAWLKEVKGKKVL